MKKSTLLSFATAGAIVMASAGTYAAWDTLTADKTATLNFGTPVVLTMDSLGEGNASQRTTLGEAPKIETTAVINLENSDDLGEKIELIPTIEGTVPLTPGTDYTLEIAADTTYSQGEVQTETANTKFYDSNVTAGTKTYKITITLTEAGQNKLKADPDANSLKLAAELK